MRRCGVVVRCGAVRRCGDGSKPRLGSLTKTERGTLGADQTT